MSFGETVAPFFGRVILAWFFLSEALRYSRDWDGTVTLLAMKHVPVPAIFIYASLALVVLGCFSIVTGFRTRMGAIALFLYTIMITIIVHDYWNISNAAARLADYEIFARNIAIAGGLLVIVGIGAGRFALENVKGSGGRR